MWNGLADLVQGEGGGPSDNAALLRPAGVFPFTRPLGRSARRYPRCGLPSCAAGRLTAFFRRCTVPRSGMGRSPTGRPGRDEVRPRRTLTSRFRWMEVAGSGDAPAVNGGGWRLYGGVEFAVSSTFRCVFLVDGFCCRGLREIGVVGGKTVFVWCRTGRLWLTWLAGDVVLLWRPL